jgi:hypothetical protein
MTRRSIALTFAAVLGILAGGPSIVLSQVPPGGGGAGAGGGIPSKQEIEKAIKEELDKIPETTTELGKVKISYKAVPSDPTEALKNSGKLPPGMKPDQAAKQFAPMARPYVEKFLAEVGKLVTEQEFKLKSTTIKPAEYTFGIVVSDPDLSPVAIVISGKTLKAPIKLPLKPQAAPGSFDKLKVEIKDGKKAGEEFTIEVGFAKGLGAAGKFELAKK